MTFYVNTGCLTLPMFFKYLNPPPIPAHEDLSISSFLTLSYEMMNQLTLTTGNR